MSRRYRSRSLVLETEWDAGGGRRAVVTDALACTGPPRLLRLVRATGGEVEMSAAFGPALDAARARTVLSIAGRRAVATAGGSSLAALSPSAWIRRADGTATSTFLVGPGAPADLIAASPDDLGDPVPEPDPAGDSPGPAAGFDAGLGPAAGFDAGLGPAAGFAAGLIDETLGWWQRALLPLSIEPSALAVRTVGEGAAVAAVELAAAVLVGLRQRGGGIVAAPTTSLPQWPGSSRTWDYRYAWLRDGALAGIALARSGLIEEAFSLGEFIGSVAAEGTPALVRVDGTPGPQEATLDHLSGHGGARPVRIGNAAAQQPQLDAAGEVVELATELSRHGDLESGLRRSVPRLASWAAGAWERPDHGIWEIRGAPRRYTHSRILAWFALTRAAALARRRLVEGDPGAWEAAAERIRTAVLSGTATGAGTAAGAALELHEGGGGADAALALTSLLGFLPAGDPRVGATLRLITSRLGGSGLIERHESEIDDPAGPCAPFIFPTFWTASALEACGGDGAPLFAAAFGARGAMGLLGEVADPVGHSPLGNYPQVQSHAALIIATTAGPPTA